MVGFCKFGNRYGIFPHPCSTTLMLIRPDNMDFDNFWSHKRHYNLLPTTNGCPKSGRRGCSWRSNYRRLVRDATFRSCMFCKHQGTPSLTGVRTRLAWISPNAYFTFWQHFAKHTVAHFIIQTGRSARTRQRVLWGFWSRLFYWLLAHFMTIRLSKYFSAFLLDNLQGGLFWLAVALHSYGEAWLLMDAYSWKRRFNLGRNWVRSEFIYITKSGLLE